MAIGEEKPLTIGAVCKELKAEFEPLTKLMKEASRPPRR